MHDHTQTHDHDHHHDDLDHELALRNPAEFWDDVYAEAGDIMWSGNPNGTVEVELADVPPGRALDIGCGEGADAMWLAERGWEVTAVDVSPVAIERARVAAAAAAPTGRAGSVTWQAVNVLVDPPEPKAYDLVLMMYPAFHHPVSAETIRAIADAVAPGGTLLAVHHVVNLDHAAEHGYDPSQFVSVADIAEALADTDFTVDAHETRLRPNPPPDAHHTDDEVLRLTRTG